MPKIVFIGAGSTVFAKNLLSDILLLPELSQSHIVLQDIDPVRLGTSQIVASKIKSALEVKPQIETTTDQAAALVDADYVITMFQIGGYEPSTKIDFEIPKKYGLNQTIKICYIILCTRLPSPKKTMLKILGFYREQQ